MARVEFARSVDSDWWLSRADPADSDALVVAAKGGHNAETKSRNDLGAFVLRARGESLLADLGSAVCDAENSVSSTSLDDADDEESLVVRSAGHSVPLVNGSEQAVGADRAAAVLDRTAGGDADTFALDLTAGYPDDAALTSLTRTFTLDRAADRLRVADEAAFADGTRTIANPSHEFVELLVSYFPMRAVENGVEIRGERGRATVTADPAPATVTVGHIESAVGDDDVWRAQLSYRADDEISVGLDVAVE